MQNYFRGSRHCVPYAGNFESIRSYLNLKPFSQSDPECRCLTFSYGILYDEGAHICDGNVFG